MITDRETAILDRYLDEPEPRDYDLEEEIWLERADLEYDSRREDEILGRDW